LLFPLPFHIYYFVPPSMHACMHACIYALIRFPIFLLPCVQCVQRALSHRWTVHLWSWRASLNHVYREMAEANPNLHIRLLDHHRDRLQPLRF
jgi:hypothetical protein